MRISKKQSCENISSQIIASEYSPCRRIGSRIIQVRDKYVMVDRDLAELYKVPTKALNQAVKRNSERFPERFRFALTPLEKDEVVTNCDHLKSLRFSHRPVFRCSHAGGSFEKASWRDGAACMQESWQAYADRSCEVQQPVQGLNNHTLRRLPRQVPHHRQRGVARARFVHKLSRSPHHFLFHTRADGGCEVAGNGAMNHGQKTTSRQCPTRYLCRRNGGCGRACDWGFGV